MDADGGPNYTLKSHVKQSFSTWHVEQLLKQAKPGVDTSAIDVNLKIGDIQNHSVTWLEKAMEYVRVQRGVQTGFDKTGISALWKEEWRTLAAENLQALGATTFNYNLPASRAVISPPVLA